MAYPDNPDRDEFYHQPKDSFPAQKFRVAGTSYLGYQPFTRGQVITAYDLGPGAEIQRLVDDGILAEVPDDAVSEQDPNLMPIRPVPVESVFPPPPAPKGGNRPPAHPTPPATTVEPKGPEHVRGRFAPVGEQSEAAKEQAKERKP